MSYPEHDNHRGQGITETVFFLPLYLLFVFGLLQLGQLATALLVTNYAASAIARQLVLDNKTDASQYEERFKNLMTVGMKKNSAYLKEVVDVTGPVGNVQVHACAEVDAFPFVSQFLGKSLAANIGGSASQCLTLGMLAFNSAMPGSFVIHGQATARMNYQR
jgi:hypothetical protein